VPFSWCLVATVLGDYVPTEPHFADGGAGASFAGLTSINFNGAPALWSINAAR